MKLIISEIDLLQVPPGALIQAETCFEKIPKIVCALWNKYKLKRIVIISLVCVLLKVKKIFNIFYLLHSPEKFVLAQKSQFLRNSSKMFRLIITKISLD